MNSGEDNLDQDYGIVPKSENEKKILEQSQILNDVLKLLKDKGASISIGGITIGSEKDANRVSISLGNDISSVDKNKNKDYNYENKQSSELSKKSKLSLEEIWKESKKWRQEILKSDDKNIIQKVEEAYKDDNSLAVEIDDIKSLIKREDFIDLIVEKRIPFFTTKNSLLAEDYCRALFYLSDKILKIKENSHDLGEIMTSSADKFAKEMGPTFDALDDKKITSYNGKAVYLNEKGIRTSRGKVWTSMAVKNTYLRWKKIKVEDEEEEQSKKSTSSKKIPKPE